MVTRVSDLSVDELRNLIREVMMQTFNELFRDPDEGLELRQDFMDELQQSIKIFKTKENTITAESIANKLGLNW